MIKIFSIAVTITCAVICTLIMSCGKHFYILKVKELNKYAAAAREPGPQVFVVYENGDTIKGTTLKKRHNATNGKTAWELDGKEIKLENIKAYQDKYGYRLGIYSRLLQGKMNFYMYREDNSRLVTHYQEGTKSFVTTTTGAPHTSFYMGEREYTELITFSSLAQAMKNCPLASKQVGIEFDGSIWNRNPSYNINDYRALFRIFNIYNTNKCN